MGIIDNTALGGDFSTLKNNWEEVFSDKSGREQQPCGAAVPGREEGARQCWVQCCPEGTRVFLAGCSQGFGENDQTSPSVARLVKTNIRGIVHCR